MSEHESPSGLPGRVFGLVMMLLGAGVIWGGLELRGAGAALVATWFGPFAVCVGLAALIEGPPIPMKEATPLLNWAGILGTASGVIFVLGLVFL